MITNELITPIRYALINRESKLLLNQWKCVLIKYVSLKEYNDITMHNNSMQ